MRPHLPFFTRNAYVWLAGVGIIGAALHLTQIIQWLNFPGAVWCSNLAGIVIFLRDGSHRHMEDKGIQVVVRNTPGGLGRCPRRSVACLRTIFHRSGLFRSSHHNVMEFHIENTGRQAGKVLTHPFLVPVRTLALCIGALKSADGGWV